MAKTKKPVNALESRLNKIAEEYTYQAVMGWALSAAIMHDYATVISKMEGVEADQVGKRIMTFAQGMLAKHGWAVYGKQTEAGTVPALGMIWDENMFFKTAPVPVLRMPMEVDAEKPVTKKRKRYT